MTITIQTDLESHTCAVCGIYFAAPEHWIKKHCREEGHNLYCPAGHSLGFGTSELKKAQDALAQEKSRRDQEAARADAAERKLKRVAGGTCPCCNRHFKALYRHITNKHPHFVHT